MKKKITPYTVGPISEILKMDGRGTIVAPSVLGPRCSSVSISIASVRRVIQAFEKSGHSVHSANRSMLGFVLAHCEEKGIPYTLKASFTKDGKPAGYYVERDAPLD